MWSGISLWVWFAFTSYKADISSIVCIFSIPPSSSLRHQLGVLQFNSILTPSTWRSRQIPQVMGSVYKTVPTSDAKYKSEGLLTTSSFSSTHLLEWLTEVRNNLLTRLPIYLWKVIYNSRNSQLEMCRGRYKERTSLAVLLLPNLMFTNLEAPWTLSFWVFMEVSLHRDDWLNHWPLLIKLNLHPFPLGVVWGGVGLKVPTLKSLKLILLV